MTSFFQIGASALIRSIASRAPANASPRCAAETATTTLGSPNGHVADAVLGGDRPKAVALRALAQDLRDPRLGHLGVGLVGELFDVARRALEGDDGAGAGVADERRDRGLVERLGRDSRAREPGPSAAGYRGIAASSSPGAIVASEAAYSRLTAIRSGSLAARSPTCGSRPSAAIASATVALSSSSISTESEPARSRSIAKRRTVTLTTQLPVHAAFAAKAAH